MAADLQRVDLADIPLEIASAVKLPREDVLAVDDALDHLEAVDSAGSRTRQTAILLPA